MNLPDNAYQAPSTIDPPKKTQGTAWAVWAGAGCLLVSFLCVSLALTGMASSFSAVAEASSGARPEELASGVNNALVWIMWAIPLGILGIALVTVGFVVRRPVAAPR